MDPSKRSLFASIPLISEDVDEQVNTALKYFDSILDEYLNDDDYPSKYSSSNEHKKLQSVPADQRLSYSVINLSQVNANHLTPIRKDVNRLKPPYQKALASSSSDLRHKPDKNLQAQTKETRQIKATRSAFAQTSAVDLNARSSASHMDLTKINNDKGQSSLNSMGVSASLIDLTTVNEMSARPLFRFVPTERNEQKTPTEETNKFDHSHLKIIQQNSLNPTAKNTSSTYSPDIVKPIVIVPTVIPPLPKSAPMIRSSENQFHHENEISAFKPLVSSRSNLSTFDSSNIKRTEFSREPTSLAFQVGLSNRSMRPVPYHQSMFDLATQETHKSNQQPASYPSIPAPSSSSAVRHHHYIRQSNPNSRPTRYHPAPRSPSNLLTNPVNKWLEQMKDSPTISVSQQPSYINRPYGYSTGSYLTAPSAISSYDSSNRSSNYSNQNNNRKSQFASTPPAYQPASLASSVGNIYHFNMTPNRNPSSKSRQSSYNPHGNDSILTTYL